MMPDIPDLTSWPEPDAQTIGEGPLQYDNWVGPYKNPSGERWVEQINSWYGEGTAAGLSQDTFRSFDEGHSGLRLSYFPQMQSEEPVSTFGPAGKFVFPERVTMGVQSYGVEGMAVIERHSQEIIRGYYESKFTDVGFQKFFQLFYESNFLFVAPAVSTYSDSADSFSFLSPFYLHSVGASGTDASLLKPIVFAAAALPPNIKTQALRSGRYVPTLMYLFKNAIAGDILSPESHVPAYGLPEESGDGWTGDTPFLDTLVNGAHDLDHLPPVCRLKPVSVELSVSKEHDYAERAYLELSHYGFTGTLRRDQEFKFVVDLSSSVVDDGHSLKSYHTSLLRGSGTITPVNESGSQVEVRIPWTLTDRTHDYRTDILFLVNDGTYYSSPAYISIRHIHELDPLVRGIKAE